MLATESNKYRQFTVKLFGYELFFYSKSSNMNKHSFMHTLVGTFVTKEEDVEFEGKPLYPVKVSLPPRYTRVLFFTERRGQEEWFTILKDISLS
jgi:hypothetical protein